MARLLGPVTFGLYALAWTIHRFAGIIATAGLDNATIRFAAPVWDEEPARARAYIDRILRVGIAQAALVSLGVLLLSVLLPRLFDEPALGPALRWVALGVPAFAVGRIASSGVRVTRRVGIATAIDDAVPPVVGLVVFLLAWTWGWRLGAGIAGLVAGALVSLALSFIALRRRVPATQDSIDGPDLRTLIGFSIPTALAGIATMLVVWVDRLLVGHLMDARAVGVYQAAAQPALIFATVLSAFTVILGPLFADLLARASGREELRALFVTSTRWAVTVAMPLFLVVVVAPERFIVGLFGEGYAEGVGPMRILAAAQMVNAATGAVGFLLIMSGSQRIWSVITGAALAVNVIVDIALVPHLGLTGAAFGTGVSLVLLFGSGAVLVKTRLDLWPYERSFWRTAVASLSTAVILLAGDAALPIAGVGGVVALLAIGVIAFAAVLRLLGIQPEDRALLRSIRQRASSTIEGTDG